MGDNINKMQSTSHAVYTYQSHIPFTHIYTFARSTYECKQVHTMVNLPFLS